MDYRADICMIANSLDNLELLIKMLQKRLSLPIRVTKKSSAPGKAPDTKWYYATATCDCDSMPSCDGYAWKTAFKECAEILGTNGAAIANVTDCNLASIKGNEISESEHIATTPKGRMLNYDTNFNLDFFGEEDLDYLDIPHGYEKFKKAFIRAYGAPGKEMFDVYDKI